MPWAYHVYIIDATDEEIHVEHTFYGHTKQDCTEARNEHLAHCAQFQAAEAEGRTDDLWEELAEREMPTTDGDSDDEDDVIDIGAGG